MAARKPCCWPLQAVAGKGDIIAVESPTYHGLLELIDSLGMLAIEVETCPEEGITLSALRQTLDAYPVKACLFSTTLSNPLGVSMPDAMRRELVSIIDERDITLIEDDVYGDLLFDGHRAETGGNVLAQRSGIDLRFVLENGGPGLSESAGCWPGSTGTQSCGSNARIPARPGNCSN